MKDLGRKINILMVNSFKHSFKDSQHTELAPI